MKNSVLIKLQELFEKVTSKNSIFFNAVMVKELYIRMRGKRAYFMIGTYLLVLSLIVIMSYYGIKLDYSRGNSSRSLAELGRDMFISITMAQVFFMAIFMAAITSGAISDEKEQGTFEFLTLTLLKNHHILWGKLMGAVVYIALLLLISLPVISMANLLGGFSVWDAIQVSILIILGAINIGIICIYGSASYKKTSTATGVNIGRLLLFLWISGVFFLDSISWRRSQLNDMMPAIGLIFLNPFATVGSVLYDFNPVIFGWSVSPFVLSFLITIGVAVITTAYTSTLIGPPANSQKVDFKLRLSFIAFWLINFAIFIGGFWNKQGQTLNTDPEWNAVIFAFSYLCVLMLSFAIPLVTRIPGQRIQEIKLFYQKILNSDLVYLLLCVLGPFLILAIGANLAMDFGFYDRIHFIVFALFMVLLIGITYFLFSSCVLGIFRNNPSLGRGIVFAVFAFFHFQTIYFASYDNYHYYNKNVFLNPIENFLIFLSPIYNCAAFSFAPDIFPKSIQFAGRGAFPIASLLVYLFLLLFLVILHRSLRLGQINVNPLTELKPIKHPWKT